MARKAAKGRRVSAALLLCTEPLDAEYERLRRQSERDIARAKLGRPEAEKFLIDTAVTGTQVATDAAANAINRGVGAGTYAVGEVGGDELGRVLTEDGYTPDKGRIVNSGLSAFTFSALDGLAQGMLASARDKARIQSDIADVWESYEAMTRALRDPNATAEQRAQLAQQTIDRANWASGRMDEIASFGARREIDRAQGMLGSVVEEMKPYAVGKNPFSLDSGGYSSHNTLDLGQQGSFGERMVGQIAENPQIFGMYDSPTTLKAALGAAGFEVRPLGKGALMEVPFESGGGFRVNFSDGGLLQYHPEAYSHHGGEYYKVSTGKGGTHRYDTSGREMPDRTTR